MSADDGFILRHLVREVLDSTNDADPGAIAGMVMARIPRGQVRVALSQTLRLYVRQIVSETRNSRAASVTPIRPNVSSKVSGIRDGWQRRLRDRTHGADGWKMLADCTYDDLLAAASERRDMASRNDARARQYDSWARLLTEHDVATFGDLPPEAQMNAIGRVA